MLYGALGVVGLIIFTSAVVIIIRATETVIEVLGRISKDESERNNDR